MKILRCAAVGMFVLVFASALPAQRLTGPSTIGEGMTDANSCKWTHEIAPDRVRSPVQMDIHAAYRIFAFKSDGSIG